MKLSWAKIFPQVGLDIGTSAMRLGLVGQEEIKQEPSSIWVDPSSQEILAFGHDAVKAQGRSIQVRNLVDQGIASNPVEAKMLVNWMLGQNNSLFFLAQPTYAVTVPVGATAVERLANAEVARLLGAREILTVSQPLAAAIGAKVPLQDTTGSFILHLGAGRVEAAAISLGSVVAAVSSVDAGNFLKNKLANWLQTHHGVRLAQSDLTTVLHQVLSLQPQTNRALVIRGQTVAAGKLEEIKLVADEFYPLLTSYGLDLVTMVERLLAQLSPDLLIETPVRGLLLSGGLAQLHGLDVFLSNQLQIPVAVVDQPEQVVMQGLIKILQHKTEFLSRSGGQMGTGMIDWS